MSTTKKPNDDLKALAEKAARQQMQHRQQKAQASLDLLTNDDTKQPADSYDAVIERTVASIKTARPDLDEGEIRKTLADLY